MTNEISKRMFQLDGRVAVVTGAGSGLGRVFARTLALYGADLICADIDAAGNEETVAMITGAGGVARAFTLDVADEAILGRIDSAPISSSRPPPLQPDVSRPLRTRVTHRVLETVRH